MRSEADRAVRGAHQVPERSLRGRVRFEDGRARVFPRVPAPPGWLSAVASVVSPGTELRRLAASRGREPVEAGYMTIARHPAGGLLMAPVAHGASFPPDIAGVLTVPGASLELAAVARFQLMAALGLERVAGRLAIDEPVVVGSGPVALGCILELRRKGASRVRVLSSRQPPFAADLSGVGVMPRVEAHSSSLVIDCTGRLDDSLHAVGDGGTVGLLGTPDNAACLHALQLHRRGLTVAGMHELACYSHQGYRRTYSTVVAWLAQELEGAMLARWCRTVPGAQAAELYELLSGPGRPAEPVIVLDWSLP